MKKSHLVIVLVACLLMTAGCDLLKPKRKKSEVQQSSRPAVASVELADKILRPQPYEFKIEKDPFKPVSAQTFSGFPVQGDPALEVLEVKLIGIVKIGDIRCALIKTPDKTRTYRAGESIGSWKIETIELDRAVLRKDTNEIILKVGGGDE